ncbi:hypothetical protein [Vibrio cyclitrophicus]|uniref:Uncharacterized protein n=2 Tax=Vibrio cyclitrophicus TaxID=47951 RepID=A0A7Z1MK61_9VIBR|nr:hypothetical protein [Vibrio cyclitrophicus]PMP21147.1 hypothetical protein BCS91_20675 [Vibrio cyclitrophicus]PMP30544.1 hypothetical protein BCS90_14685 [Vibrio cyclitrophicus]
MKSSIELIIIEYASTWCLKAQKSEISWRTASALIDAFELGLSEGFEMKGINDRGYLQTVMDIKQYVRNQCGEFQHAPSGPLSGEDALEQMKIKEALKTTKNFSFSAFMDCKP